MSKVVLVNTVTNAVSNVTNIDFLDGIKINGTSVLSSQGVGVDNASENLASVTTQLNQLLQSLRDIGIIDSEASSSSSSSSYSSSSSSG